MVYIEGGIHLDIVCKQLAYTTAIAKYLDDIINEQHNFVSRTHRL